MEDLKIKFKQLVSIVHPDKGGNKELFTILYNAYKEIEKNILARDNIKSQHELKDNFKTDNEEILKDQHKMKFEINNFNKIFEETNERDTSGYGDYLKNPDGANQPKTDNNIVNCQ